MSNEYISKLYIKNRNAFSSLSVHFNDLFSGSSKVKFHRKLDFYCYFDILFNDFYSNFIFFLFDKTAFLYYTTTNFFLRNVQLNTVITQNYLTYNYNHLYSRINKRNLRVFTFGRFGYLIGFKLHCLGRFSRKERASSIWFRQVKVPLNTLNAIIDFGFFTVPLRNSSATIKL